MIRSRVQEGIDTAIADGKRVGRPPFGYTVEDGFLQQIPVECRVESQDGTEIIMTYNDI